MTRTTLGSLALSLLGVSALTLAACSSAPPPDPVGTEDSALYRNPCIGNICNIAPCGALGDTCCTKTEVIGGRSYTFRTCNDASLLCSPSAGYTCVANPNAPPPCGGAGQACCPEDDGNGGKYYGACSAPNTQCVGGGGIVPSGPHGTCAPCGQLGQACCGTACAVGGCNTRAHQCQIPDPQGPTKGCQYPVSFTTHGAGVRGGPATIIPIFWAFQNSALAQKIDITYKQIESSSYYRWLETEYGAPQLQHVSAITLECNQSGGPGTCAPDTNDWPTIQAHLDDDVRNGLPGGVENSSNPIFVIHLPPGKVLTNGSGKVLCDKVLGWNGFFDRFQVTWHNPGLQTRYYILVPDPTTCPGMGYDGFTRVLTHEIAENVTDPREPSGWEDQTQPASCSGSPNSQIGDLCDGIASVITTPFTQPDTGSNRLTVQKLWSNRLNACVTEGEMWAPLD